MPKYARRARWQARASASRAKALGAAGVASVRHAGIQPLPLGGAAFRKRRGPLGGAALDLSELRRLLGEVDLGGDALTLSLPPQTLVDVHVLSRPCGPGTLALPGLGRELLEGMRFDGAPAFAAWLDSQRRRLGASSEALMREAALARLGSGSADEAAEIAARLVQLNPLDKHHQALLVRSLAAAGAARGRRSRRARRSPRGRARVPAPRGRGGRCAWRPGPACTGPPGARRRAGSCGQGP